MNLSKLFIDSLEREDEISIWRAMKKTNRFFSEQLPPDTNEENVMYYFFKNINLLQPNDKFKELMQFWNDVEKYIWDWPDQKMNNFWIIQVIQKLISIQQAFTYNKKMDECSNALLVKLQNLSDTIEDTVHKEYLVRLTEENNNYQVKNVFSLKCFDEELYHPYRDYILGKLIHWMKNEAFIVIVSGKMTPKKLSGYRLGNNDWKVCKIDILESFKDIFEINLEDKRKELIPGYIMADLW